MICDAAPQIRLGQLPRPLPASLLIGGVRVHLTTTPCHLGGHRSWFLCPSCGRRCAILYPVRCRLCQGGRYACEPLSPGNRRIARALRLRARLGQTEGGLFAPFPPKPPWMRWHTWFRLRAAALAREADIWADDRRHFPDRWPGGGT